MQTHVGSPPGVAITVRVLTTTSPILINFFRRYFPIHKAVVERLFPTLATFLITWSCHLMGFAKTRLGYHHGDEAQQRQNDGPWKHM